MTRLLPAAVAAAVGVALGLILAGAAAAETRTYSTQTIHVPLPPGSTVERALSVGDRGPVSYVQVAFRVEHPLTADLAVSLVAPDGTVVPLVAHRGAGADFGTGRGCDGELT